MTWLLQLLFKIASTEAAKIAIGMAINKLLDSKSDGITKDVAKIMIDGVCKSKANPTKEEMFSSAFDALEERIVNA